MLSKYVTIVNKTINKFQFVMTSDHNQKMFNQ